MDTINSSNDIYSSLESSRREADLPVSVDKHAAIKGQSAASIQAGKNFIKAPSLFFGKFLEVNIQGRTTEDKKVNQDNRIAFKEALHHFFGPILAEYLYSKETHEEMLQKGAPLVPDHAQKIVSKGMEMIDVLAEHCERCLDKELSQPEQLDQATIHYVQKQEESASQKSNILELLPSAAKALGGGAMAGIAVATMPHSLTPTDIFFLLDLLSSKKLSKAVEDFVTTKLVQHVERHLDFYIQERKKSSDPLGVEEEKKLRSLLSGKMDSFSHEIVYPSTKSGFIHATALAMGVAPANTPLEAIKVIFQGESFGTGGHNQLFREGVTTLVDNIKKIQDSLSKTATSAEELSKIKKAIHLIRQQKLMVAGQEDHGSVQNIPSSAPANKKINAVVKQERVFRAHLRRGI